MLRNLNDVIPIANKGDLLPTLDLAALSTEKPRHKTFAIQQIAPLAEVTLFTGPGGSGKSLLGQQLATAAAAGQSCLGLDVMAGPAIYLTCEDDADQLHWRQSHICQSMGVAMAELAGKLHLISLRGALDNELAVFDADGKMRLTEAYNRIECMIQRTGTKLVFLDNVAHLFTGNENDRGEVTRFVNLLNRLAGETGAAILLLAHPNKSGDSYSGSTAWLNAVRSQITIDHPRETDGTISDMDARVLTVGKANYAQKGDALSFRWHDWAFVRNEDLPADTQKELRETIAANRENTAFLSCLDAATESKRAVSHNPGTNYAPNVFVRMAQGKGFKKEQFQNAFERLLATRQIEIDAKLWQRENRAWKYGIKRAEKCTDHLHQPPAPTPPQVIDIACTDPHAPTPLYTTYINGAGPDGPPPHNDTEQPCPRCAGEGCGWCDREAVQ